MSANKWRRMQDVVARLGPGLFRESTGGEARPHEEWEAYSYAKRRLRERFEGREVLAPAGGPWAYNALMGIIDLTRSEEGPTGTLNG